MEPEITWLGHASLMLAAGRTIIVGVWNALLTR